MLKKITFVTSNKGKVNELQNLLQIEIIPKDIDLPEIQSLDLKEIIEKKAFEAYKIIQSPVVIEDTSLIFHALAKLPGTFVKWFLKELGTEGLCRLMNQYKNKTATAQNMIGLFDGTQISFFSGKIKGTISPVPKGTNGFGWDALFIPEGQYKTYAEMTNKEKMKFSFRKIAVEELKQFLIKAKLETSQSYISISD
ncbi:MAG TPA: RdgB/HAM1 family non-canonical purine NTP pyrophosphatase [Candidatus Woesebacteria bacterium]|nr:RdgB/HAM1 family non-canonical purine NTP pyrophosphatase [Candidatus Woesebacteria bacterium]